MDPRLVGRQERPLEVNPEHTGVNAEQGLHGAQCLPHLVFGIAENVGISEVVPKCRCALTIAAMPSGVGASLNSTSPPPFTWVSMNPGASHAPIGIWRTGIDVGSEPFGTMPAIQEPSITTAHPSCSRVPPKTLRAPTACCEGPFIGSA